MTLDQAALDREIIDVLRDDARAALPPELDERVASRLAASAGIFGLSTAVTAGSQAAAAAASATTASATTATTTAASAAAVASVPAVKLLTLGSLAKTLAFGMALGSTVGLGLHVSFQHLAKPVAPARPAALVAPAPSAAATAKPSPRSGVALEPPSGDEPVSERLPEPPRASRDEPRANPSPELPGETSPVLGAGLAAQQALLDDARAALRGGDGQGALAAIRRHTAQFPSTAFAEEREAVAIKALVLIGHASEARARTERFDARFPKSLLTPSLRAALDGKRGVADSVTGPAASSQTTSEQ